MTIVSREIFSDQAVSLGLLTRFNALLELRRLIGVKSDRGEVAEWLKAAVC